MGLAWDYCGVACGRGAAWVPCHVACVCVLGVAWWSCGLGAAWDSYRVACVLGAAWAYCGGAPRTQATR